MSMVFGFIKDETGNKTKHQQIVDGVLHAIAEKELQVGDMLPSVNMFLKKLPVARMTVVKALEELKQRGIIESENRIGYFVKNGKIQQKTKVLLLLTEFNVYHEVAYNELIHHLKNKNVTIDLFFHHCNPQVFKSILKENAGLYNLYVITPFKHPEVKKSLSEIPAKKLLQVMRNPQVEGTSYISQDFYDEVIQALKSIKHLLSKYKKVILVFPKGVRHPKVIEQAFFNFCDSCGLPFGRVLSVNKEMVRDGFAFIVIDDNDLIQLVKYGEEKGLVLGKNLGVLSYNDSPMKEIIRNGITVISTNFIQFGKEISEFIITRNPVQKRIPTTIIVRNSL